MNVMMRIKSALWSRIAGSVYIWSYCGSYILGKCWGRRASRANSWQENISGRGNCKCKGPEAAKSSVVGIPREPGWWQHSAEEETDTGCGKWVGQGSAQDQGYTALDLPSSLGWSEVCTLKPRPCFPRLPCSSASITSLPLSALTPPLRPLSLFVCHSWAAHDSHLICYTPLPTDRPVPLLPHLPSFWNPATLPSGIHSPSSAKFPTCPSCSLNISLPFLL